MRPTVFARVALGITLAGALSMPSGRAEEAKTLPTLLIKGEVVSLDTSDPSATLLKVKDRYGFETPIFLTAQTTVTREGTALDASSLAAGTPVEVEYNFDVNTAKRHAVSVIVAAPPAAAEPAAEAAPAAPAAAPVPIEAPAPAEPSAPAEAPATPEAPAEPAPAPGEEAAPAP